MKKLDFSLIFKTLSDCNRFSIIETLKSGEKCACQILKDMNIVQSTLSHHMKGLCESGLVDCRKEGKWVHYSLNKDTVTKVLEYFNTLDKAVDRKNNQCKCDF